MVGSPIGVFGGQTAGPRAIGVSHLKVADSSRMGVWGGVEFGGISQSDRETFCMWIVESVIRKVWVTSYLVN